MAFFAYYDKEMTRNRFLVVLITPFIVISIVPLLAMKLSTFHIDFFIEVAFLNAFMACVDLLVYFFGSEPSTKKSDNCYKGIKSYWK